MVNCSHWSQHGAPDTAFVRYAADAPIKCGRCGTEVVEGDRLRAENATLRAATRHACVAMSLQYGHDRGTLADGYEDVMQHHGGGMAYAYELLRAALAAPAAGEPDGV